MIIKILSIGIIGLGIFYFFRRSPTNPVSLIVTFVLPPSADKIKFLRETYQPTSMQQLNDTQYVITFDNSEVGDQVIRELDGPSIQVRYERPVTLE